MKKIIIFFVHCVSIEKTLKHTLQCVIDMFKRHEILLFICYSTQKTDIGTVVGLENIF